MSKNWNDIMFDDVGKKIKATARIIAWILIIIFIVLGSIMFLIGLINIQDIPWMIFVAPIYVAFGCVAAWLSVITTYGFGELVDKVCSIERNTRGGETKSEAQSKIDSERTNRIEKLRSQGLITEEEYQQAISKGHQEV